MGNSVNAGVARDTYLGVESALSFPTVNDIMHELRRIGPGANIYKIDISHAFRHLKVDPLDYDLLGLYWNATYVDTCLPFGSRHGSQLFQRISDVVRFALRQQGFKYVNYIDDLVGFETPDVAEK